MYVIKNLMVSLVFDQHIRHFNVCLQGFCLTVGDLGLSKVLIDNMIKISLCLDL